MSIAAYLPSDPNEPPTAPDRRIQGLVALFLRLGLGLTILSGGVSSYLAPSMPGLYVPIFGGGMNFSPGNPGMGQEFTRVAAQARIILGVLLVFGFLTTVATCFALAIQAILPMLMLIASMIDQSTANLQNVLAQQMFGDSSRLTLVLVGAMTLWFSRVKTNRYSIDALVFPGGGPRVVIGNSSGNARLLQNDGRGYPIGPVARSPEPEVEATPIEG